MVMAADRPYGDFMNFTMSVRNILDRPSYMCDLIMGIIKHSMCNQAIIGYLTFVC
jgi:hypothetical protein